MIVKKVWVGVQRRNGRCRRIDTLYMAGLVGDRPRVVTVPVTRVPVSDSTAKVSDECYDDIPTYQVKGRLITLLPGIAFPEYNFRTLPHMTVPGQVLGSEAAEKVKAWFMRTSRQDKQCKTK